MNDWLPHSTVLFLWSGITTLVTSNRLFLDDGVIVRYFKWFGLYLRISMAYFLQTMGEKSVKINMHIF